MTTLLDPPTPAPAPPRRPDRYDGVWRRGRIIALLASLAAAIMLGPSLIPDRPGHLGSLLQTFLPWTGLAVPVLLVCAVVRRSATATVALLLPAIVWTSLFGGRCIDKRAAGGDLTVVTHNVNEHNPHPARTARALAGSGADVLALEELGDNTPVYERALAAGHPYHSVHGTVGLWSRYPLADARTVDIAPWPRALRATVRPPEGPVAVYVAHLSSVRFGVTSGFGTDARDAGARRLAAALRAEPLARTVLVGDLNGTTDDDALSALTSDLRSAQDAAGKGFGLSWPAAFPLARIDHILVRGVESRSAWTLPATDSDHLPVAASLRLRGGP
ncbi:endonuclease/exonuclease/phosphatase family protein [Streptomyces sp. KAU_LT]|uniref:endonuclease/exonuclease/phosphatase family protein n=1 Tax=Streptomyces sp. KAU_LT TaxID=3046669 RepID=UPI0024B8134F|nr:endonuclease/exonuclease/phosphatase family protein [Streptomyces sp. KAU_LT]MDI9832839.1 endonuclease/exonuclease/phosphatase family protein [Streptomyces sp. KAU_LT]